MRTVLKGLALTFSVLIVSTLLMLALAAALWSHHA